MNNPSGECNEINLGAGSQAHQAAAGSNISQTYIAQQIVNAPEPPREWKAPKQMLNVVPTFVGRHDALEKLATLGALGVTAPRLLLVGIGGFGKTTLAAQITHDLEHGFDGGILLAEFPTVDVFLKLDEWAKLYDGDVQEIQDLNQRADRVREIIQQRVGRKRVLAVLDGIVDENDEPKLVPLVRALSDCAVLATTRDKYLPSLYHFREIPVQEFDTQDAVALFQRVLPNDKRFDGSETQIHALGAAVDWLPFALDLLAKQLDKHREWTLANLQTKLAQSKLELLKWGSVNEKEKGIFASFLLSYNGLNENEKLFFPTLGAFGGSDFDIQASAYVARGHPQRSTDKEDDRVRVGQVSAAQAEQMLEHLLELSMVQTGSAMGRYRLHALMREFARTLCGENLYDADLRMATHYCDIAVENGKKLHGKEMEHALAILDAEVSNIFAGQKWARENETRKATELTRDYISSAMIRYFHIRTRWNEWIKWSRTGLRACEVLEDEKTYSNIANSLGLAYAGLGEYDKALSYFRQSLEISEKVSDLEGVALAFMNTGNLFSQMGEYDRAILLLTKALQLFVDSNNLRGQADTYGSLALVYDGLFTSVYELRHRTELGSSAALFEATDREVIARALHYYRKCLDLLEQLGDIRGMAMNYHNLARFLTIGHAWDEAIIYYEKSLQVTEKLEDYRSASASLFAMGMIFQKQGKVDLAIAKIEAAIKYREKFAYSGIQKDYDYLEELKSAQQEKS